MESRHQTSGFLELCFLPIQLAWHGKSSPDIRVSRALRAELASSYRSFIDWQQGHIWNPWGFYCHYLQFLLIFPLYNEVITNSQPVQPPQHRLPHQTSSLSPDFWKYIYIYTHTYTYTESVSLYIYIYIYILSWNSLCRSGWPWTHKGLPCLCLELKVCITMLDLRNRLYHCVGKNI
jgi:hypothetical protein